MTVWSRSSTWGAIKTALAASAVVHGLGLTSLAYFGLPDVLTPRMLELEREPFAGEPVAIALSIARPAAEIAPLPDVPPSESPVLITPHGAQIGQRVFVEKTTEQVMQEPPAKRSPPSAQAELQTSLPLAAEDRSPTPLQADGPPAPDQPVPANVPRTPRRTPVAQSASASVPQVLGVKSRQAARMSNNRPPRYPEIAKRNNWEGTVLLKLSIDAAGKVTEVSVARSSGHAILDAEAVNAVRMWQGEPALEDGKPVASEEWLPVRFRR